MTTTMEVAVIHSLIASPEMTARLIQEFPPYRGRLTVTWLRRIAKAGLLTDVFSTYHGGGVAEYVDEVDESIYRIDRLLATHGEPMPDGGRQLDAHVHFVVDGVLSTFAVEFTRRPGFMHGTSTTLARVRGEV